MGACDVASRVLGCGSILSAKGVTRAPRDAISHRSAPVAGVCRVVEIALRYFCFVTDGRCCKFALGRSAAFLKIVEVLSQQQRYLKTHMCAALMQYTWACSSIATSSRTSSTFSQCLVRPVVFALCQRAKHALPTRCNTLLWLQ